MSRWSGAWLRTGVVLAGIASTTATYAEPAVPLRLTHDGQFKQRPAWSPDGTSLIFTRHRGATMTLWQLTLATGAEVRVTENQDPEFDAVFAPDGKSLLYSFDKASPNQGDIEVYRWDFDARQSTPIATTRGQLSHEEWATWSPDGKRVAFTTTRHGNQELAVADLNGENEVRLTSDPALDLHPAWSPDGRHLLFATARWGDLELARIDSDGKNLVRITDSPGLDDYPAWSPDGKWLAFCSNRSGDLEIYVAEADGRDPRNVTQTEGSDTFPTFSPRGELTWVGQRESGWDLFSITVANDPRFAAPRPQAAPTGAAAGDP